ncbi:hypothetical protein [Nocardioides endophyticus]|uniref:hypothetical protein n=1 Tax=Nocardioides endophyticus TaxID=1353775 RepID=UPI0031E9C20B
MRTYRTCWGFTAILVTAVAVVAAVPSVGVGPLLAETVALAILGLTFGVAWSVDGQRWWRPARQGATWFALGGILVIGLPEAIGAWSIPVLVLIGSSAPVVVEQANRYWRARRPVKATDHPEKLSDRDLMRRWRSSYDEMRRQGCPATDVLRLVQERSLLLDEVERRDPAGFEQWLERVAPRETQDR